MFFLIQLKDNPDELFLVRATSRLDAFNLTKLIDVPKKCWHCENFDTRLMRHAAKKIKLE